MKKVRKFAGGRLAVWLCVGLAIASVLAVTIGLWQTVSAQGSLSVTAPASAAFAGKTVSTTQQTDTAVIGNTATDDIGIRVTDTRGPTQHFSCVMTVTHLTTRATTKELVDAAPDNVVDFTGTYDGLDGVRDPPGTFKVVIDSAGARGAATFDWWDPAGNVGGESVLTADSVSLSNEISVTFDDTTYSVGDSWSAAVDVFPYTSLTATPARLYAITGITGVTVGSAGYMAGTAATSNAKTIMTAVDGHSPGDYYIDVDLSQTIHQNSLAGTYTSVATITVS